MTIPAPKSDPFDQLLDTYIEELNAMSDEQALGGTDPAIMEKEGVELLQRSREAVGRRRLLAARTKLVQQKALLVAVGVAPAVTAQEARRFLAQVANDGRYTMAARELKDMPDQEALRLYAQIKKLEGEQTPPGNEA
jgi:hypothetical protein